MIYSAATFYDNLADSYHLIYPDWRREVRRQSEVLDGLIRGAIGLALFAHEVTATDLSPNAIRRASEEAGTFGVSMTFGVADFRSLAEQVAGEFDVVISCDNSLPHLLDDEDLLLAAHNIRAKLREGGLFLASMRDYDQVLRERPGATVPSVSGSPGGRRVYFQVWATGALTQFTCFSSTSPVGAGKSSITKHDTGPSCGRNSPKRFKGRAFGM